MVENSSTISFKGRGFKSRRLASSSSRSFPESSTYTGSVFVTEILNQKTCFSMTTTTSRLLTLASRTPTKKKIRSRLLVEVLATQPRR
jgi:hypothetical protein